MIFDLYIHIRFILNKTNQNEMKRKPEENKSKNEQILIRFK